MKAMVLREFGQRLRLEDVKVPKVGPKDALVKVAVCAIARLDNWTRMGVMTPIWHVKLPLILGHQIAGEIAEVGQEVTNIKPGDRAIVHALITCETCKYCRTMMESHCPQHTHIGVETDGGLAEFVKVPASNAIKIPDDMTFEAASMIPANIGCSWHILSRRAQLKPLEDVLVIGAGGGIGIHLIQLAKSLGAKRTIGVDVSEEALKKLKELGVDHGILSTGRKVTFDKEVIEITGGRGVDVAVEFACTAETLEATVRSMATGGRMVIVGVHRGSGFTLNPAAVLLKELVVTGSRALSRIETVEAVELLHRSMVKPVVTARFPLEEANEALELNMSNKVVGRSVISIQ